LLVPCRFLHQIDCPNLRLCNYEEEIEVSDNWSRFIVLKSSEDGVPLTKIPPFVIEKCIKSCAGEVKYATKLKSGGLMIECQRKQQSLNLLSLKQIHNINISSTMSDILTLKASYWIRDIYTDFNIVKAHAYR
jgi:hypothetical protein